MEAGRQTRQHRDAGMMADNLNALAGATEWLVDYPIRYIDDVRWDSFDNISEITFRELMGDHNVVGARRDMVNSVMEKGSIYIADPYGVYRLMRPLLTGSECTDCGRLSIFGINTWDKAKQEAIYRALDHRHSTRIVGSRRAMENCGLL